MRILSAVEKHLAKLSFGGKVQNILLARSNCIYVLYSDTQTKNQGSFQRIILR